MVMAKNLAEHGVWGVTRYEFTKKHFPGDKVIVSDVGAINFLADVRCLDVDGLASKETFDLKLTGGLTRDAIASLSRGASVAILYGRVFTAGRIPSGWRNVGSWKIPDNVICGDDTVFFYSIEGTDQEDLTAKLRQFGTGMPSDIQQAIVDAPRPTSGAGGR